MQAPIKCPRCGLDLGAYVETHCPQCGVNLAPKPPLTAGIWLLNLTVAICGTLLVLASVFVFAFYMNSSSHAHLYEGAPYHATTFRVTSVQYTRSASARIDGSTSLDITASAIGIVEGQKEAMDLLPYLNGIPREQDELMERVPEGTVIPVYLFPTLRGQNRIQLIHAVPTEEWYRERATWASNRALPVVGVIGILTALLSLARFFLSSNRRVAN